MPLFVASFCAPDPDEGRASPYARFALAYARLVIEDEARRAWLARNARTPDPDECDEKPVCAVCGKPVDVNRFTGQPTRVCGACCKKGWRAAPCLCCGGITHKRDRASKRNTGKLYGFCGKCRAEHRTHWKFSEAA